MRVIPSGRRILVREEEIALGRCVARHARRARISRDYLAFLVETHPATARVDEDGLPDGLELWLAQRRLGLDGQTIGVTVARGAEHVFDTRDRRRLVHHDTLHGLGNYERIGGLVVSITGALRRRISLLRNCCHTVDERVMVDHARKVYVVRLWLCAHELADHHEDAHDGVVAIWGKGLLHRCIDINGADLRHLDRMARVSCAQGDRRADIAVNAPGNELMQLVARHAGYVNLTIKHGRLRNKLRTGLLNRGKRETAAPENDDHRGNAYDERLLRGTHLLLRFLGMRG